MSIKDGEKRDGEIAISGTASLKSLMDEFVANNSQTLNSMDTLVDRAARYLVKRYEAAESRIDMDGFPLDVAQRIGASTNALLKPRRRSAPQPPPPPVERVASRLGIERTAT